MAELLVTLIATEPQQGFVHPDTRSEAENGGAPQQEGPHFTGLYGQMGLNTVRRTRQDANARK
jgi:hypothetical protein